MKRLYSSNIRDNTLEVATAAALTTLGGNGSNESNSRDENVAWLGISGKTARRKPTRSQQ